MVLLGTPFRPKHRNSAPGLIGLAFIAFALGCGGESIFRSDLPAPQGLVAAPSSQSLSVQLSWTAEAEATAGYEIWRSSNGGDSARVGVALAAAWLDTTVPAGTLLSYTVRGVNSAGAGADSVPANAVTIPGAVGGISALSVDDTSIEIGWSEATGAAGNDAVTVLGADGTTLNGIASGPGFTANGLLPNTSYLFTVVARNETGAGAPATRVIATLALSAGGGSGGGSGGGAGGGSAGGAGGGSGVACTILEASNLIQANIATSYSSSFAGAFVPFDPAVGSVPVADWIQLDSSGSVSELGIASTTWQLVSAPAADTGMLANSTSAQALLQLTAAGSYVVSLTIADAGGCTATAQVQIQAGTIVTHPIVLTLTWAEACGDLDLHYLAPTDTFCSATDLDYDHPSPDWGCATSGCGHEEDPGGPYADGSSSDDGELVSDSQWGSGATGELITHSAPFDSPAGLPYEVWVYYYSSIPDDGSTPTPSTCGTTHPTVNVSFNGASLGTFTLSTGLLPAQGYAWHAANIDVSNQGTSATATATNLAPVIVPSCTGGGQ